MKGKTTSPPIEVSVDVLDKSSDPVTRLEARRFVDLVAQGVPVHEALIRRGLDYRELNRASSQFRAEVIRIIDESELEDEERSRLLRAALNTILVRGLRPGASKTEVSQALTAAKLMSEDARLEYRGSRREQPTIDVRVIAGLIEKGKDVEEEKTE